MTSHLEPGGGGGHGRGGAGGGGGATAIGQLNQSIRDGTNEAHQTTVRERGGEAEGGNRVVFHLCG